MTHDFVGVGDGVVGVGVGVSEVGGGVDECVVDGWDVVGVGCAVVVGPPACDVLRGAGVGDALVEGSPATLLGGT
jgi:hypothetical protein